MKFAKLTLKRFPALRACVSPGYLIWSQVLVKKIKLHEHFIRCGGELAISGLQKITPPVSSPLINGSTSGEDLNKFHRFRQLFTIHEVLEIWLGRHE